MILWHWALLILGFFSCGTVGAFTLNVDLTVASGSTIGDAVWNSSRGEVHPPLEIYQYQDGTAQDRTFSIGQGRHGPFNLSTYANFSSGGNTSGNVIRIDTSVYDSLDFTEFTLESGWTIQPIGANPLVIRVLGNAFVKGTISCSGANGENQTGSVLVGGTGGMGRCGGGAGGSGGTSTSSGADGSIGGVVVTDCVSLGVDGPSGGMGASGAGGGGGGGAYAPPRASPDASENGNGTSPGARGETCEDNDFDNIGGGFGGGGGGYFGGGAGGQNSGGAGGGGGGGSIYIHAGGNISITGQVLARGGNGGTTNGTSLAGGGGGGAGGSIAMFAGGEVYLAGSAVVSAAGGAGLGPAGREGGNGAAGRTWLVGNSGYSILVAPLVTPEFPDPSVANVGLVRYQLGTFTIASSAIDSRSSAPTLTAVNSSATLPGASTLQLNVAASSTPGGFTSYLATTSLPIVLDRYLSVQVVLTNADRVTPAKLILLSFTMTGVQENQFDFVSACGRFGPIEMAFLMIPPFVLILRRRFLLRFRTTVPG